MQVHKIDAVTSVLYIIDLLEYKENILLFHLYIRENVRKPCPISTQTNDANRAMNRIGRSDVNMWTKRALKSSVPVNHKIDA